MKNLYFLFTFFVLLNACNSNESMDLIVYNAKIFTVDSLLSQAQAFAIKDGKFVEIGTDETIFKFTCKEKIDAKGAYIYPGFIDAHCHFTGYAHDSYKLDLVGTTSFEEVLKKVNEYAKTCDREWIEGRGWDQNDWENKSFPTKDALDKLFPDKPIFLLRIDGHAAICNQKALNLANITCDFKVAGGENILKNGECTGLLIDNAVDSVKKFIPKLEEDDAIKYYFQMADKCFAYGLTSVVDCGVNANVIDWIQKAYQQNLQMRSAFMLSDHPENFKKYLHKHPKSNDYFSVIGYKFYADGALGSRGAYLLKNYADREHHQGFLLTSTDSMLWAAKELYKNNYQMCTHAIGDGGVHEVLKIYQSVLPKGNDKRWRIEHAQVVDENDFHFFKDYNIIPSVQPTHATSDMYWAEQRLGKERIKNAYAYKRLLNQNAWMPLGTDFPVESINPFYTFCSAVFRKDNKNFPQNGFQIENALSREEALKGISIWAAKSTFDDKIKGSIEKGKLADFVITDINLMKDSYDKIYNAKIKATFIAGKKVFERND